MSFFDRRNFWRDAFTFQGSITPHVMPYVLAVGAIAAGICELAWLSRKWFGITIDLEVAPFELVGTALGLLLILRTNAGYDRWWEARKLWGSIVNQSRNVAIDALAYGPNDHRWQVAFVTWVAVFPHAVRCHLRGEPPSSEIVRLLGPEGARRLGTAQHMPNHIMLALAELLREACERFDTDRFVFLQIDRERALLIDHMGGCERILKTPLPMVYAIKIRRFIALFLLTLPLALLHRVTHVWLVPVITMMVAYPLFSLDQTGIELQNPFSKSNVGHLPLTDISNTIEQNVLGLLKEKQATAGDAPAAGNGQPGVVGEVHSQS